MYNPTIKISQLNICGLSDHSRLALNHFIYESDLQVMLLNETKRLVAANELDNYSAESTIRQNGQGGVAVLLKKGIHHTRVSCLENDSFDSAWVITVINGKKLLVGTAYIPPNTQDSLSNLIHSLDLANKYHIDNLLDGVVFIGDCNARHIAWGDSVTNAHGIHLHEHLVPDYKIYNDSGPTFLSSNGSSVIDLILVSGQVTNL